MKGGNLRKHIKSNNRLSKKISTLYFTRFAIYNDKPFKKVISRHDLKPDNILLATLDENALVSDA